MRPSDSTSGSNPGWGFRRRCSPCPRGHPGACRSTGKRSALPYQVPPFVREGCSPPLCPQDTPGYLTRNVQFHTGPRSFSQSGPGPPAKRQGRTPPPGLRKREESPAATRPEESHTPPAGSRPLPPGSGPGQNSPAPARPRRGQNGGSGSHSAAVPGKEPPAAPAAVWEESPPVPDTAPPSAQVEKSSSPSWQDRTPGDTSSRI